MDIKKIIKEEIDDFNWVGDVEQDSEDGYVLLSYGRIWSVLKKDFGLKRSETEELIKRWLGETYNLMGFTPKFITPTLNLTKSYLSSNK